MTKNRKQVSTVTSRPFASNDTHSTKILVAARAHTYRTMCGGSPPSSKDSKPSPFDSFPSFTSEDEGSNRPVDASALDGPCEQDYNTDTADTFNFASRRATKLCTSRSIPFSRTHPNAKVPIQELRKQEETFSPQSPSRPLRSVSFLEHEVRQGSFGSLKSAGDERESRPATSRACNTVRDPKA